MGHRTGKSVKKVPLQIVASTYGDQKSLRMYRLLGFRDVTEQPAVDHLLSKWSVLAVTPHQLMNNYKKLIFNFQIYSNFEISMPVNPGDADGGRTIEFDGNRGVSVSSKNKTLGGNLAKPTEISPGLFFSKGANAIFKNGNPSYIQLLDQDFRVSQDLVIPRGSSVAFNKEGGIDDIDHLGREIRFLGMRIPKYSQIYFGENYPLPKIITILRVKETSPHQLVPGVEIGRYAQLKLEQYQNVIKVQFISDENTKINNLPITQRSIVQILLSDQALPSIEVFPESSK